MQTMKCCFTNGLRTHLLLICERGNIFASESDAQVNVIILQQSARATQQVRQSVQRTDWQRFGLVLFFKLIIVGGESW